MIPSAGRERTLAAAVPAPASEPATLRGIPLHAPPQPQRCATRALPVRKEKPRRRHLEKERLLFCVVCGEFPFSTADANPLKRGRHSHNSLADNRIESARREFLTHDARRESVLM